MSVAKIIKISVVSLLVLMALLSFLYLISPYLIAIKFSREVVETEPKKYWGTEVLPEDSMILFVTAHPDDLEFICGGTLPKLIHRHNDVFLLLLTNGGKQRYMPKFYSKQIVKTRRKEQLAIAKIEGLEKVFFINYSDGSLTLSEEAVEEVMRVAQETRASYIFTFEPGKGNGHYDPDHDVAGQIATIVAKKLNMIEALFYFRAAETNVVVDISDTFERKLDILFMFSEFRYRKRILRALHKGWSSVDGERIGVKYAEAFRKVDVHTGQKAN